jgi:hypothetical protein
MSQNFKTNKEYYEELTNRYWNAREDNDKNAELEAAEEIMKEYESGEYGRDGNAFLVGLIDAVKTSLSSQQPSPQDEPFNLSQLNVEEHVAETYGSTDLNAVITEDLAYDADDSISGLSQFSGSSYAPSNVVTNAAEYTKDAINEVQDNEDYETLFELVKAASSNLELRENICGRVEIVRGAADLANATTSFVATAAFQVADPYFTCVGNFLALAQLAVKSTPAFASKAASAVAKVPDVIDKLQKKGVELMETMKVHVELLKLDLDKSELQQSQATFILRELTMISRFTDLLLAMLNQKLIEHNTEDITFEILRELADDEIIFSVFEIIQTVFLIHRGDERATELSGQPKTLRYRMNMIIEVLLLSQNNPLPTMMSIRSLDYNGIVSVLPKIDFLEEFVLPSSFAYTLVIHHMSGSYIINLKHALVLIEYNKLVSGRYSDESARDAQANAAESDDARHFREDLDAFMKIFNDRQGTIDQRFIDTQLQTLAGITRNAPRTARNKLPTKSRDMLPITVSELAERINDTYRGPGPGPVITRDAIRLFGAAAGDERIREDTKITDENLLLIVSRLTNSTIFMEEDMSAAFTNGDYNPGRNIMNFDVVVQFLSSGNRVDDISRSTKLFLEARLLEIVGPQRLTCSTQSNVNAAKHQAELAATRTQFNAKILTDKKPPSNIWRKKEGFNGGIKSKKNHKKQQKKQTRKTGGKRSTRKLRKNHKKRSVHTKKH